MDLYDVINKRDEEVIKLKEQIKNWQATDKELCFVIEMFQIDIESILTNNAKNDIC